MHARPGDKALCRFCSLTLKLAPWDTLADGTVLFAWRQVNGQRSPYCASHRAPCDGRHRPNYSTLKKASK